VVALAIEITPRREARDAENAARATLRSVLETVPDYITQVDREGVVTFINRTYPGVTPEQVVGTRLTNWIAPIDRARYASTLERVLSTGQPERVLVVGTGENRQTWYESFIAPIKSGAAIVGATLVGRDVSEQQRAELERRRRSRLETLGQLAAAVAHDFNNILGVIRAISEDVAGSVAAGDLSQVPDDMQEILAATARSSELTGQLLDLGRLDNRSTASTEVCAALRQAQRLVVSALGQRIAFSIDTPAGELWARLDPLGLQQILINLATNARQALTRGGSVRCSVRAGAASDPILKNGLRPAAVLSFADDGPGIPRDLQERIFEPFFTVGDHDGTGLGLATVHEIVLEVGGEIALASTPGEGTTFTIYLGAARSREIRASEASGETYAGTETVLLVEDERALRTTMARYLSRLGYTTLEGESVTDALDVARAHPGAVDVLVADLGLPDGTGVDVAGPLSERYPDLRVLYMTGYISDSERSLVGSAPTLRKPFSRVEFAREVRAQLDLRKQT
jgi:PAS domain S-box-containing protein